MCMEPISTMTLQGCYKPTVNEPETIIEAQAVLLGPQPKGTRKLAGLRFHLSGPSHIERS